MMRESVRSYQGEAAEDWAVQRSPMQSGAFRGLDAPASSIARSTKSLIEKLDELR